MATLRVSLEGINGRATKYLLKILLAAAETHSLTFEKDIFKVDSCLGFITAVKKYIYFH